MEIDGIVYFCEHNLILHFIINRQVKQIAKKKGLGF